MSKGWPASGVEVTSRDDALFYNSLIGKNGIYNYGNRLEHQIISANKINIKDGIIHVQGRNYVIYPNEVQALTIDNGTQGVKRYDLIVFEIVKSSSSETLSLKVIKGTPSTQPKDPELTQQDTLSSGLKYQFPLYRIKLNGIAIEGVDDLRTYIPSMNDTVKALKYESGILTVEIPDNITYKSLNDISNSKVTLEEPIIKEE